MAMVFYYIKKLRGNAFKMRLGVIIFVWLYVVFLTIPKGGI